MIWSIVRRTLREGVTFEDFREAWRPEPGLDHADFTVVHARSLAEPREVVSIGHHDMTPQEFEALATSEDFARVNAARHERIAPLVEEADGFLGAYEVIEGDEISI